MFFTLFSIFGSSIPNYQPELSYLKISGSGAITKEGISDNAVAFKITKVEIVDNIDTISDNAFVTCSNLETVIIRAPVSIIGQYSFSNLKKLQSISFGTALTRIQNRAFEGCSLLPSVVLPAKVSVLESGAFILNHALKSVTFASDSELTFIGSQCFYQDPFTEFTIPPTTKTIQGEAFRFTKISYLFIPKSVTSLGDGITSTCGLLLKIDVDPDNTVYSSENGVVFNKLKTRLIQFPNGKAGPYVVPDTVQNITKSSFFSSEQITSVKFGRDLKMVDDSSFAYCPKLSELIINSNLENIGVNAFIGCIIPQFEIPLSMVSYGSGAFTDGPTVVTLASGHPIFEKYSNGIIYIKTTKEVVFVPQTETVDLSQTGITKIGKMLLNRYTKMKHIIFPSTLTLIEEYAFRGSGICEINLPKACTKIDPYVFHSCQSLTEVNCPDDCQLTYINSYAFQACSKLATFNLGANSQLQIVSAFTFHGCSSLTSFILPSTLTRLGDSCFTNCANLAELTIKGDVQLGKSMLTGCLKLVKLQLGIVTIPLIAFKNTPSVETIKFLTGTNFIGVSAFEGCQTLKTIEFEDGMVIDQINGQAFAYCSSIVNISLPMINEFTPNAFSFCSSLLNIFLKTENPKYSSEDGILYSGDLQELLICPSGRPTAKLISQATRIGPLAFYGCENLIDIDMGVNVSEIAKLCFYGCASLVTINIPKGMKKVGERAFEECSKLKFVFFCSITNQIIADDDPFPTTTNIYVPDKFVGDFLMNHKVIKSNSLRDDGCPIPPSAQFSRKIKPVIRSDLSKFIRCSVLFAYLLFIF